VGVDLDIFNPEVDSSWVKAKYNITGDIILYVGQLHGAQYVELLLKAAKKVLFKNNSVTFMVVGDGFKRKKLQKLAKELGVAQNVVFTGFVSYQNIPAYICAAEICVACFADNFVTNSKSPLKVVEYLACGRAVIASRVAEVEKMVKASGVLVEPGDYHDLADNILKLMQDKKKRYQLSKKARARAEYYSWDRTIDKLLTAYKQ
jgi:glycosyltransferase involved in cell wall biosynthesis